MKEKRLNIIDRLLSALPEKTAARFNTFEDWKKVYYWRISTLEEPVDMAVAGGFYADRVAFAFAAGYHAALQKLVPDLPKETIVSFCVTEEDGGHPRAIKSRLEPAENSSKSEWRLNGRKQFVTCAAEAELFLVAASKGMGNDGKNRLKLVLLERSATGLTVEVMKDLPFVPEISHGIIHLNDVIVKDSRILPGDGYTSYIKPFRTLEDLHVNAAILGYLFRIAKQFRWPKNTGEQILSLIVATKTLAISDSSLPAVHIALGGLLTQTKQLISDLDPLWENVEPEIKSAWKRDSALMNIAEKARASRLNTAWSHYKET
ncbi:MAG: acyl-CoA dehydrogenase family protein, partial [Deltaproteobacteria bacterium]|nr:acyl-CoA dehydrogenase family protein [Deltaproteobacteria bacterium]